MTQKFTIILKHRFPPIFPTRPALLVPIKLAMNEGAPLYGLLRGQMHEARDRPLPLSKLNELGFMKMNRLIGCAEWMGVRSIQKRSNHTYLYVICCVMPLWTQKQETKPQTWATGPQSRISHRLIAEWRKNATNRLKIRFVHFFRLLFGGQSRIKYLELFFEEIPNLRVYSSSFITSIQCENFSRIKNVVIVEYFTVMWCVVPATKLETIWHFTIGMNDIGKL